MLSDRSISREFFYSSYCLVCLSQSPELQEQPVDLGVDPGQPVEPLGHDPVAVHELDALVHDDRYVLVGHLLI